MAEIYLFMHVKSIPMNRYMFGVVLQSKARPFALDIHIPTRLGEDHGMRVSCVTLVQ